jgi:hypothetical protein
VQTATEPVRVLRREPDFDGVIAPMRQRRKDRWSD